MTEQIKSLPAPGGLSMTLSDALAKRSSGRDYSAAALSDEALSSLLWACAGQSRENGKRTVPSAMDCREVAAFVVDADGCWLYDAAGNELRLTSPGDHRAETTQYQEFVATAAVTIVFCLDNTRTGGLVGSRAERCINIDAGCMVMAAQLAATALGLSSVCRASFNVDDVRRSLGVSEQYRPVVAVTVGVPA